MNHSEHQTGRPGEKTETVAEDRWVAERRAFAERLVAQFRRNQFAGANQRAELAARRVQKLNGAARREY